MSRGLSTKRLHVGWPLGPIDHQSIGDRSQMPVDEGSTLTRAELADALHRTVGLSRSDAFHLVEQILARMSDALASGENVKIANFGSFLLNDKRERIGRNPKTGVEVPVSARRVVTFRPSHGLRDQVARSPET